MKVKILSEHGYQEAALGFSLSYNSTIDRAKSLFPVFAFKQGGENKFLESIYLWLEVTAPRYWWQEADTYRISTKQSESTMHTLSKGYLVKEDFENDDILDDTLDYINNHISLKNNVYWSEHKVEWLIALKNMLPEGFLQKRIWVINYKTLQNIYSQRYNHRLPQWKYFCDETLNQIEHPEFIRRQ